MEDTTMPISEENLSEYRLDTPIPSIGEYRRHALKYWPEPEATENATMLLAAEKRAQQTLAWIKDHRYKLCIRNGQSCGLPRSLKQEAKLYAAGYRPYLIDESGRLRINALGFWAIGAKCGRPAH